MKEFTVVLFRNKEKNSEIASTKNTKCPLKRPKIFTNVSTKLKLYC